MALTCLFMLSHSKIVSPWPCGHLGKERMFLPYLPCLSEPPFWGDLYGHSLKDLWPLCLWYSSHKEQRTMLSSKGYFVNGTVPAPDTGSQPISSRAQVFNSPIGSFVLFMYFLAKKKNKQVHYCSLNLLPTLTSYDSMIQKLGANTVGCLSCASYSTQHFPYISSWNLHSFLIRKMEITIGPPHK